MRIQTLAAATLLGTVAMLPLATGALAEEPDCTMVQADLNGLPDARIDRPGCGEARNHPVGRPHHDDQRDRHEPRCTDSVRDRIRHLGLDRLRDQLPEQLREGDWPKDWPEDWKQAWRDCHGDPSDPEPADDEDRPERVDSDDDGDRAHDDGDDGDSADSDDDNDDDDNDSRSTQVKVVPKGSVDTGDGSSI